MKESVFQIKTKVDDLENLKIVCENTRLASE